MLYFKEFQVRMVRVLSSDNNFPEYSQALCKTHVNKTKKAESANQV